MKDFSGVGRCQIMVMSRLLPFGGKFFLPSAVNFLFVLRLCLLLVQVCQKDLLEVKLKALLQPIAIILIVQCLLRI